MQRNSHNIIATSILVAGLLASLTLFSEEDLRDAVSRGNVGALFDSVDASFLFESMETDSYDFALISPAPDTDVLLSISQEFYVDGELMVELDVFEEMRGVLAEMPEDKQAYATLMYERTFGLYRLSDVPNHLRCYIDLSELSEATLKTYIGGQWQTRPAVFLDSAAGKASSHAFAVGELPFNERVPALSVYVTRPDEPFVFCAADATVAEIVQSYKQVWIVYFTVVPFE